MSTSRSVPVPAATSMPTISEGVLKRFHNHPPDFEYLYRKLQRTNPGIALWLLSEAENFAPGDVAEKQKYATLALRLYGMLADQVDIGRLSELLDFAPKAHGSISPGQASSLEATSDPT